MLSNSTFMERKPNLDRWRKATTTNGRVEDHGTGKKRCIQNHQDRDDSTSNSGRGPYILLKRESGCICLDSWRYARYRRKHHRTPSKRWSKEEACPAEITSIDPQAKQSYHGRSRQAPSDRLHQRSILPKVAGQCHHGKKVKWEMKDMCRLHRP